MKTINKVEGRGSKRGKKKTSGFAESNPNEGGVEFEWSLLVRWNDEGREL